MPNRSRSAIGGLLPALWNSRERIVTGHHAAGFLPPELAPAALHVIPERAHGRIGSAVQNLTEKVGLRAAEDIKVSHWRTPSHAYQRGTNTR